MSAQFLRLLNLATLVWSAWSLSQRWHKKGNITRPENKVPADGRVAWAIPRGAAVPPTPGYHDLVFMHVPYNFGHTLEYVGAFGKGPQALYKFGSVLMYNRNPKVPLQWKWNNLYRTLGASWKKASIWGAVNPVLMMQSSVGCPLYMTPPKLWPQNIAEAYFGNKKRFAILRDPYERFVAMFRGSAGGETGENYGGNYKDFISTCNVDGAVRSMLAEDLQANPYAHGCTFVPQHEYFEGPYGAEIIADNREFPYSVNRILRDHQYDELLIDPDDALHVTGCTEVWSGTLQNSTKEMIRKIYAKDFEMICKNFGYCKEEDTCLKYVPMMCPRNMTLVNDDLPGMRLPPGMLSDDFGSNVQILELPENLPHTS